MISIQILRLFTCLYLSQRSLAAPVIPNTNSSSALSSSYVGYVGDPNGRGTASLVISCVLTLILCVWSALHLNVPRQNDSILQCLSLYIRWIITGVYAPELVVFTAWRQWCSANILSNIIRDLQARKGAPPTTPSHYEWTKTHSFFASTGGFAFEIEDAGRFLPNNCSRRLTLTACGMAFLAKCGHLPNVSEAEITDKSKANDIAKALVLIQASWMLVQVIGRVIAKLPVTLLEINTIAHVMCAFLMYAMWWSKPLAPKEPFILRGKWVDSISAYMYMSSGMSGQANEKTIVSQTVVKTLFAGFHLFSKVPELESTSLHLPKHSEDLTAVDDASDSSFSTAPASGADNTVRVGSLNMDDQLSPAQGLVPASKSCLAESISRKLEKTTGTAFFERRPRIKGVTLNPGDVSQTAINRWALAASAIDSYPTIKEHYLSYSHHQGQCLHFRSEEMLVSRVQNWPWDDLLRNVNGLVVGMILWLACLAYGAIHLTAWNVHFPTVAEQWLWRSSSLYIGFCGGLWIILNYLTQAYQPLNNFWDSWMDGGGTWWQNIIIGVPVIICGLSLVFARAFVVVEAFVSIRELPVGAYETPTWTQVFPHL